MGLAASQARFLGLTARKSNVEYKGQQINQARTALSNEVNGLYNEYNKLKVPTPPVKQDYVKTKYVLNTENQNVSIGTFSKINSGKYAGYYNVTLQFDDSVPVIYTYNSKNSIITAKKDANNSYSYLNIKMGTEKYTYDSTNEEESDIKKIEVTEANYDEIITKYTGLEEYMKKNKFNSGTFYMFVRNNMPYFTSDADLNATSFEHNEDEDTYNYHGNYSFDYQSNKSVTHNAQVIAAIGKASSGRLTTIDIIETEDEKAQALKGNVYSIRTSADDNEEAYEDAMNQYNYNQAIYEKEVERINLKTKLLQKEDRSLELQLNQLDTEQNAIKTEMESVSKVIEDTIQKVFKTYNSSSS